MAFRIKDGAESLTHLKTFQRCTPYKKLIFFELIPIFTVYLIVIFILKIFPPGTWRINIFSKTSKNEEKLNKYSCWVLFDINRYIHYKQ
jgi:hypothetical protein